MVHMCWVPGCKNKTTTTGAKVSYFQLPYNDLPRLNTWLSNIGRMDFKDSPNHLLKIKSKRICAFHFEKKMLTTHKSKLRKGAVPTIFNENQGLRALEESKTQNMVAQETRIMNEIKRKKTRDGRKPFTCAVPNCGNTSNQKILFFDFPSYHERCHKWLNNICREDLSSKVSDLCFLNYYVCQQHFEREYFNYDCTTLTVSAIPTLNLPVDKILRYDKNLDIEDNENFIVYSTVEKSFVPIARCTIGSKEFKDNEIFWSKDENCIGEDVMVVPDFEIKTTCRVCLANIRENEESLSLKSICNEVNMDYNQMLQECSLNLDFYENTQLPTSICQACSKDIVKLYCFVIIFKNSQNTLKQYTEMIKQKNDLNYGTDLNNAVKKPPNIDNLMAEWAETHNKKSKGEKKNGKNYRYGPKITQVRNEDNKDAINKNSGEIKNEIVHENSGDSNSSFDMNEMLLLNDSQKPNQEANEQNSREQNHKSILLYLLTGEKNHKITEEHKTKDLEKQPIKKKGERINIYRRDDYKLVKIEDDNTHLKLLPNHGFDKTTQQIPKFAKIENGCIKVYECLECDKKFYTFGGRMRHVRKYHATRVRTYIRKKQCNFKRLPETDGYLCQQCGQKFDNRRKYRNHILRHNSKRTHTCNICDKKFSYRGGLTQHLTLHENIKPYLCTVCGKSFRLRGNLLIHEKSHSKVRPVLTCPICKKTWRSQGRLNFCLKIHNGTVEKYPCEHCAKVFITAQGLEKHYENHEQENKNFECELCRENIFGLKNFKQHLKAHPEDFEQKKLFGIRTLVKKVQGSSAAESYFSPQKPPRVTPMKRCPYCKKSFISDKVISSHCIQMHSNLFEDINNAEEVAGNVIITPESRMVHENKTSGTIEKNYILLQKNLEIINMDNYNAVECQNFKQGVLNQNFKVEIYSQNFEEDTSTHNSQNIKGAAQSENSNDSNLLVPIYEIRSSENLDNIENFEQESDELSFAKGHICPSCNQLCGSLKTLIQHSTSCNMIICCEKCPLTFDNHYMHVLHSETHIEKHYFCRFCNKTYATPINLKAHERFHTKEKSFVCNICQKRFFQKQKLIEHLRTHSGEKNFVCKICDRRFSIQKNLTIHERRHTNFRPYKCFECGQKFFDSSSRKKHCNNYHEGRGSVDVIVNDEGNDSSNLDIFIESN